LSKDSSYKWKLAKQPRDIFSSFPSHRDRPLFPLSPIQLVQALYQGVNRREAKHSPTSYVKVYNAWKFTSKPPILAWPSTKKSINRIYINVCLLHIPLHVSISTIIFQVVTQEYNRRYYILTTMDL
jgi:hypothetical protein